MTTKKLDTVLRREVGELTFGMFLKAARTSMELNQVQMANRLGIKRGTLCDIEKGRQLVSPTLAKKIARKSGLSETVAVKACLQDQLTKAHINLRVVLIA